MSLFGALDEFRHTQIPLLLMHELVGWDRQFDWTWRFYHSNNWVAIAARHLIDELLLGTDPIEFAIATHFVLRDRVHQPAVRGPGGAGPRRGRQDVREDGDQHPDRRGPPRPDRPGGAAHRGRARPRVRPVPGRQVVLAQLAAVRGRHRLHHGLPHARWRRAPSPSRSSWRSGCSTSSLPSLEEHGLRKPWYWDTFLKSLDYYHHMVYASAYTYRASVWFNFVVPGPEERAWLRQKYPAFLDGARSGLGADHRPLAAGRSGQRLRRARHGHRQLLQPVPAGAVRRHARRPTRPW